MLRINLGVLMVLEPKKFSKLSAREGGYLFCNHCGGYYQLKKGESPRDFVKCECDNPLEFCKTKETLDKKIIDLHRKKDAFNHFENRVLERRESLKDLFPKVIVEDDFIKDMQEEGGLWELLNNEFVKKESDTNPESNLSNQKKYLDIILEEERLMANISQKKNRVKNQTLMDRIVFFYNQTDPIRLLGVIIILLIIILFLTVINPFKL
jgi:hypothetical protein